MDVMPLNFVSGVSYKQKRFVRYAAEFISFGKPQKKRTKEKRFSRHSNPNAGSTPGFSDSPSLARSENGGHPARRPSGLEARSARKVLSKNTRAKALFGFASSFASKKV
ncbi:hypothetical protein [Luteimonas panaciterrae]|uniref:hypothetical protein n=1 Tax=Luteimonas panaciterrae TaxID=363885 RepID=UPI001CF9A99C|nr:hypothetical protein [Luteimonas panaciterrae]